MTRLFLTLFLAVTLSGCLTLAKSGQSAETDTDPLLNGITALEKNGKTRPLNELLKNEPETLRGKSARSILTIYAVQQKRIEQLDKKNRELSDENARLQQTLEKLNKINLEMEKRSR